MSKETAEMRQVHEAFEELKTSIGDERAETKEKIDKLNAVLDAQEEKNQANVIALKSAEKASDELKERMEVMELELSRSGGKKDVNYKETPEYKTLDKFVKSGMTALDAEEIKTLRTDTDTAGGYLVPTEMDNMITKQITEISAIRSIARVRTIGSKSLEMPIRTSIPVAAYEGEAEQGGDSESGYANETLTAYRQTFTTPITMDMLMDSAFNMESEILSDAGEAFANGEGAGFVSGTGVKQPEGFLTNSDVVAGARESAASGVVSADDVILLTGDLKAGYNPVYVMNRRTLAQLRTEKSTDGVFLWQPGMNGPVANTINGFPYLLANDMPDIAASSLSIAFGDFRRGYTIVDRAGLSVIRDDYTQKKLAIVEFTMNRWNTGQVTLAEAITLLQTKA